MAKSERLTDESDERLVAGVLEGRGDCFEALHARYRSRIFRFAFKRLSDEAEAEDVTQEVFLQVHRCLPDFQGRSSLLTWMFGIAHHQVCRRYRCKTPSVTLDASEVVTLASPDIRPEQRLDAARMLARVEEVLEREISPTQRRMFYMRYAENRPTRAIAKEVGKSNQAVKIGLFRSRRKLQRSAPELRLAHGA